MIFSIKRTLSFVIDFLISFLFLVVFELVVASTWFVFSGLNSKSFLVFSIGYVYFPVVFSVRDYGLLRAVFIGKTFFKQEVYSIRLDKEGCYKPVKYIQSLVRSFLFFLCSRIGCNFNK